MRHSLLYLVLVTGLASADTPIPAPTKPDEPVARTFSPANAAGYIDGVGVAWTRDRKCATCHTNVPFMLARPKVKGGDPAPMKEVREFLEATVTKWEKQKPRADYEVVATAFALAGQRCRHDGQAASVDEDRPRQDVDAATAGRVVELARLRLAPT